MNKLSTLFFSFFLIIGLSGPVQALEVGAAKVDVTPSLNKPVWLAGFQPYRAAASINDPIWARSIVFANGGEVIAHSVVDCIGLLHYDLWEVRKKVARKLKISPTCIVISSTHTHSGPDTLGIWGQPPAKTGRDEGYMKKLKEKIAQSLIQAYRNKKPAQIRFGQKKHSKYLKDSRRPHITDPLVSALQAVDQQGQTIATLVNYAMHPEVLTGKSKVLSSDFSHYLREKIERELGGICLFNVGAIGGLQTPRAPKRNIKYTKVVGEALAQAAIDALKNQPWEKKTDLYIETIPLLIPLDNIKFILGAYAGLFGREARKKFLSQSKILPLWYMPCDITVFNIGRIQVVTVPGELVPELGHQIKKWMKGRDKFIIGVANNMVGYILKKSHWSPKGYEETMSLGPETAPVLMKGMKGLVRRANRKLPR